MLFQIIDTRKQNIFECNNSISFLIKIASRLTCIFYDKIICVSEFDRHAAIKNKIAPEKKLITVHNGIDIDESGFLSREEAIEKLKNKNQKLKIAIQNLKLENIIIIGTVGEFTKNKGTYHWPARRIFWRGDLEGGCFGRRVGHRIIKKSGHKI